MTDTRAANGAPERRRHREQRMLGHTLGSLLLAGPSLDEVSRLLHALLGGPLTLRAVAIFGVNGPDVDPLGCFVDESEDLPRTRALALLHQVACQASPAGLTLQAASIAGQGLCLVSESLGTSTHPQGILTLIVEEAVDVDRVRSCLADVSGVLAIHLAGLQSGAAGAQGSDHRPGPVRLTPRQHAVLERLAEGLTMRQIAARIGFSDSTVRAESLAIYRALGVHDRDDAVAAAIGLGLLDASALSRRDGQGRIHTLVPFDAAGASDFGFAGGHPMNVHPTGPAGDVSA